MLEHRSQMLWFRYLYVAFSRYMWVNTLKPITMAPSNPGTKQEWSVSLSGWFIHHDQTLDTSTIIGASTISSQSGQPWHPVRQEDAFSDLDVPLCSMMVKALHPRPCVQFWSEHLTAHTHEVTCSRPLSTERNTESKPPSSTLGETPAGFSNKMATVVYWRYGTACPGKETFVVVFLAVRSIRLELWKTLQY